MSWLESSRWMHRGAKGRVSDFNPLFFKDDCQIPDFFGGPDVCRSQYPNGKG